MLKHQFSSCYLWPRLIIASFFVAAGLIACSGGNSSSNGNQPQISAFAASTPTENIVDLVTAFVPGGQFLYQASIAREQNNSLIVKRCQRQSSCQDLASNLGQSGVTRVALAAADNGLVYVLFAQGTSLSLKKFSGGIWADVNLPNLNPTNKKIESLALATDDKGKLVLAVHLNDNSLLLAEQADPLQPVVQVSGVLPNYQYGGRIGLSRCGSGYLCLAINAYTGTNTLIQVFTLATSQTPLTATLLADSSGQVLNYGLYPALAYESLSDSLFLSYKNNYVKSAGETQFKIFRYQHPHQANGSWQLAYSQANLPHGYNSLAAEPGYLLAAFQDQATKQDRLKLFKVSSSGSLQLFSATTLAYHGGFNQVLATAIVKQFVYSFQDRKGNNHVQSLLLQY